MQRNRQSVLIGVVLAGIATAAGLTGPATAGAEPDLPDLSGLTSVDTRLYQTFSRGSTGLTFSTAAGQSCYFLPGIETADETASQGLWCTGRFPGVDTSPPPKSYRNGCYFSRVSDNRGLIYYINEDAEVAPCDQEPYGRELSLGSKIVSGRITCGVPEVDVTVCIDTRAGQRHGFILQPAGSEAF